MKMKTTCSMEWQYVVRCLFPCIHSINLEWPLIFSISPCTTFLPAIYDCAISFLPFNIWYEKLNNCCVYGSPFTITIQTESAEQVCCMLCHLGDAVSFTYLSFLTNTYFTHSLIWSLGGISYSHARSSEKASDYILTFLFSSLIS